MQYGTYGTVGIRLVLFAIQDSWDHEEKGSIL